MAAPRTFIRYRFPAVLWAMLIFAGSSIPSKAFPVIKIFEFDKFIHLAVFFVFGFLVYRSLARTDDGVAFSWSRATLATLVVVVYGILDEFHQSFVPGRTPDVWDATADTLGGIVAVIVLFAYYRWKATKPRMET